MGMIVTTTIIGNRLTLVPEDQVHQKVQEKFPSLDLYAEDPIVMMMKIAKWNILEETPEEIA